MPLEAAILAGNARLEQAAGGGPSVKLAPPHDDADAVRRIQKALVALGHPMPRSFPSGAGGEPDGKFGQETYDAVVAFQKVAFPNESRQWDGRVGKNTLAAMDKRLPKQPGPAPAPPAATAITSMKFWMNAFSPASVPGYTRVVPAGPHAGLTMIPGPTPWADCYLTDQRSFDNNIHAKSRMHSEATIDFTASPPAMTQWHNCDWTTECDCEDGEEECHKVGDVKRMKFEVASSSASRVELKMTCSANNPCSEGSTLVGDIDFTGTVTFDLGRREVSFQGLIDDFPAFEAYATINHGAGVALFKERPPTGHTVTDLPGAASRPISGSVRDADGDGVFDAPPP